MGGVVLLAGTVSDSVVEMHTVAELARCIDSLEQAAVTPDRVIGVQRSSVPGCLTAHTDCTMAEARLETHRTGAPEPHNAPVAADKGRTAHTVMDCAGPVVGHIDCTVSASWLRWMLSP
jgi:hypothetical protein